MKKLLLLPLFICFSVNAQDHAVKDTSKLTVRNIYDDAKTGFKEAISGMKELATRLEGPAKHVYNVFIYQHRARGIAFAFVPLILLVLGMILLLKNWKNARFVEDEYSPKKGDNGAAFAALAGIILCVIGIICSVVFFAGPFLTKIINPEYYAIQDIIQAFK